MTMEIPSSDKRLLIKAFIWIPLAMIGAVLVALVLKAGFPIFTLVWMIVPLVALLRSRDPKQIGFRAVAFKELVVTSALAVAALVLITVLFEPWSHADLKMYGLALASPTQDATFVWLQRFAGIPGIAGTLAYSGLISLFGEELFFRGWLLQWLLKRMRPLWAVLLQATVFDVLVNFLVALVMPPLQSAVYLVPYSWLAVGVVNGWAAVRTRSIWPGLISATLGILLGVLIVRL